MTHVRLKGINRVRRRLADGSVIELHYASRDKGATCFWRSDSGVIMGSPEYIRALAEVAPRTPAKGLFREITQAWLASGDFAVLAPRTQSDMMISIRQPKTGIDAEFGSAPRAVFEDSRIRQTVLGWRDRIGGRVGDLRLRHLQRIIGWAHDRGMLRHHHLQHVRGIYKANRAEVMWMPDEIEAFRRGAPPYVARILIAACETGLRPGDLLTLGPQHLHRTPRGQRLVVWTRKRGRRASIPVTPDMAALIAATPDGQETYLATQTGAPWSHEDQLGATVRKWRDKLKIRSELRLYDARGTAATRLLLAGADMKEIATHMGWSLKHASEVIEHYVALSPEMSDSLADKVARIREPGS